MTKRRVLEPEEREALLDLRVDLSTELPLPYIARAALEKLHITAGMVATRLRLPKETVAGWLDESIEMREDERGELRWFVRARIEEAML